MKYKAYFDGLCEDRNPGGYGCWGVAIFDEDGKEVLANQACIGHGEGMTNNRAEYAGLIACIEHLALMLEPEDTFVIYGDSRLVVNQVTGKWACNAPNLIPLKNEAQRDLFKLIGVRFMMGSAALVWIPREDNARADELSQKAYKDATGKNVVARVRG